MAHAYDRSMLLGLPRRIFLTTDGIAYFFTIPFTAVLSFYLLGIEGTQAVIFIATVLGLMGVACMVTVISYRKLFSPILRYFRAVLESREVEDAEFSAAKKMFFSLSRKRGLEALISWSLLMPAAIIVFGLLFHPTLKTLVTLVSLFFIDAMAMSAIYYLSIERHTRRIARTGIFSRRAEGEEAMRTRLGTALSLVVIALIAVFSGLMVLIAYNIIHDAMYRNRIVEMKTAASILSGRAADILDLDEDEEALRYRFARAFAGLSRDGRYVVLVDRDGVILHHPDGTAISRSADAFPWGRALMSGEDDCFEFRDGAGGEITISCRAVAEERGFRIAYMTLLSEIDRAGRPIALFMLAFAAAGLVAIGFGVYRMVAGRLAPLEECSAVIRETGRGNLHQEVMSYSTDEPGSILLTMGKFLSDLRSFVSRIQGISGDLASASMQMSVTAESFSDNAQQQASTAEEVTATAEQVSAGVDHVASDTNRQYEGMTLLLAQIKDLDRSISETAAMIREAADISSDISRKAKEGEQSLADMNGAMTEVSRSSEEMTGIVKIINDISERINLLSLNAAIEAARAGDAGRGFAVVADEISKLADQTATSIKEIDRLIKANTEQIRSGMSHIGSTTGNIGAIITGVTTITSRMAALNENIRRQETIKESVRSEGDEAQERSDQIRIATEEQKRAMAEIVVSITKINDLTQSIAAGTEQMTANLKGIENMAESLKEGIEYFKTS